MKDTELKRMKAEALYSVYLKGLKDGQFDSLTRAGRYCSRQPAPRFFISPKQASLLVGRIFSNSTLRDLHASQRRMVYRLYHDYGHYLEEHPDTCLPRVRIMEILVDNPAPEFYISEEGARKMLREQIRMVRRKKGW